MRKVTAPFKKANVKEFYNAPLDWPLKIPNFYLITQRCRISLLQLSSLQQKRKLKEKITLICNNRRNAR